MKWNYTSINDLDIEEKIMCSVCGKEILDILYNPIDWSDEQELWIKKIWRINPEDFCVCERCLEGYCGYGDSRLHANGWLREKIKQYKDFP